jgi:hypothetical protein
MKRSLSHCVIPVADNPYSLPLICSESVNRAPRPPSLCTCLRERTRLSLPLRGRIGAPDGIVDVHAHYLSKNFSDLSEDR